MIENRVWTPPLQDAETLVSYSRNAEDIRLWRVFGKVGNGFYADIGAADPSVGSVSRIFYDHGWSGINVEPGPGLDALSAARGRDVNLRIAVGESERPSQRRLESILRDYADAQTIHFLRVAREGAQREVLASNDWDRFRPIVVLVEAVDVRSTTPTHEAWEQILLDAEYELAALDGINRFYVDRDHHDLIPALAYPVSALDRFVTAATEATRAELAEARHESEQLGQSLAQAHAELERAWQSLETVYQSRTWRVGKMIVATGKTALRVAQVGRRAAPSTGAEESPSRAYAAVVGPGQPWHFSQESVRPRPVPVTSRLEDVVDRFGASQESVDASGGSALTAAIERAGWTDEESLLAGNTSWEERQAIVETDAIVRLVKARQDNTSNGLRRRVSSTGPAVVLDARSLQDPNYATRGVGRHGRGVLEATRMAAAGHDLVLLTSADLPDLDEQLSELADDVVVTPYPVRAADVRLFVQLSPMTASCAAVVPFLARPTCATASVVYDFIPTQFPAAYLSSASSALTNRARTEALRHYDVLLPISAATGAACTEVLGACTPAASVTGVGDPLDGVQPTPPAVDGPYMLVSAGGDPRKNIAAAVAALARHRRTARDARSTRGLRAGRRDSPKPLRAIVTATLGPEQASALIDLARALGLPEDALELRGYVNDQELAGLCESADLAFVPSLVEGFSIPVAEAARRGTPVVASDIPAHRELIGAGPWLAPGTDVDALADAIGQVRADPAAVVAEQRRVLGDTADPGAVLDRVAAALEPLLARGRTLNGSVPPSTVRPRVAVVSPFPPQRSGVADYTAYTFRQVASYADVDLYTSASPEDSGPLRVHPLSSAPYLDRRLDAVVNVVGNSHFHFPILDLMGAYGGAAISHDNRMLESYRHDRGDAWTATLLSRSGRAVRADEIGEFLVDLDRLPAIGYDLIARQASPLIVHGRSLAERIHRETGIRPEVVSFVPYNVPTLETIDGTVSDQCRRALHLSDDVMHVATFGLVDSRTKGTDRIIEALSLLRARGRAAHLHIVGELPPEEGRSLESLAAQLGIAPHVTFHGRVKTATLNEFLLAVDVAVQIRMSSVLSLSGALADCIAFGVPSVTTQDIADEMSAPAYVATTGSTTRPSLIAEAIDGLCERRRRSAATIEAERREYLETHTVDSYARGLLAALGLWS